MDELTVLTWRLPRVDSAALEAVTLAPSTRTERLRELRDAVGAPELAYVSTCQRVAVAFLHAPQEPSAIARAALEKHRGAPVAEPERFHGRDAFRHLAETASSLDSFVLGEPQVLGQFKDGVRQSEEDGVAGPGLRHVFSLVFRAAKAVRTQTDLFRGKVSLLPLTEDLVTARLAPLASPRAAVLGTGPIGARMAQMLREKRPDVSLTLVSRDAARAHEAVAAQGGGAHAMTLHEFLERPPRVDIVACAMDATTPVLDAPALHALASHGPLLVLDLALPRNTSAGDPLPPGLTLVQMDDLARLSDERKAQRASEAATARAVLERELDAIEREYAERRLAHDLHELAARFEEVARARLANAPMTRDDPAFAKWYEQTVRALLHEAATAVKKAGCE